MRIDQLTPFSTAPIKYSRDKVFDTPWKIVSNLWRWLAYPRVRLEFGLNKIPWGKGWRCYGVPVIQKHRQSLMEFGSGLQLRSSIRSNPLGANRPVCITTWQSGAILKIGDNFGMTGGTICAAEKVIIGNNVIVGANSTIVDTDFHPLNPNERQLCPNQGQTASIVIEDDVFIGMNCLILKGVTIGKGSVIGAGSVVSKDVPAGVVCAGNPATVIRPV